MRSICRVLWALCVFGFFSGSNDLVSDRRVTTAAKGCAEELRKRRASSLDKDAVDFFLEKAGVHDAAVSSSFLLSSSASREEPLAPGDMADIKNGGFTHYGMGAAASGNTRFACLIATKREVEMGHLPLKVRPGQALDVKGQAIGPARPSEILLLSPSGAVKKFSIVGRGRAFSKKIRIPSEKGQAVLEVIVEDEWGPRPAVIARIYSGVSPPAAPPAGQPRSSFPSSVKQAEKEAFHLLNSDRRSHGLPPLAGMPELGRAARKHSKKMKKLGRLAHIIPGEGGPEERIRSARIPHMNISENVAVGQSVEDTESSLMMSPGHRVNILDPKATHVGIGVALADGPGGKVLYLTQDFIAAVEKKDPAAAASSVLEIVNRARAKKGLRTVAVDRGLSTAAEEHSSSMLARKELSPAGVLDRVRQRGIQYTRIRVEVIQTQALNDVKEAGTKSPMAGVIGIGAIQDDDGTFWITLILCEPREKASF